MGKSPFRLAPVVLAVLLPSAVAAQPERAMPAPPAVSVRGVSVVEATRTARDAVLTLRLSRASARPASIRFATADGSARAGVDYVGRSGVVAFKPAQTSSEVRVRVVGDKVPEAEETFFLVLSRPRGVRISTRRATVRIAPSDLPDPFALHADMSGTEYVPPPGHPTGRGTVRLVLDPVREQVAYTITVSGMDVGESGICRAARGQDPTPVLRLDYPPQAKGSKYVELATILEMFKAPEGFCVLARLDFTAPGIRGQLARTS